MQFSITIDIKWPLHCSLSIAVSREEISVVSRDLFAVSSVSFFTIMPLTALLLPVGS